MATRNVGRRWCCRDLAEAKQRVDFCDRIQRERLLSIQGQTRRAAFPGLSIRGGSTAGSGVNWDLGQAEAVLEGYVGRRRVPQQGQVSVCGRNGVGKKHAGLAANVQYDSRLQDLGDRAAAADSGRAALRGGGAGNQPRENHDVGHREKGLSFGREGGPDQGSTLPVARQNVMSALEAKPTVDSAGPPVATKGRARD